MWSITETHSAMAPASQRKCCHSVSNHLKGGLSYISVICDTKELKRVSHFCVLLFLVFLLEKTGASCQIYCKISQKHSEHILHAGGKLSTETASFQSCCGNNGLSFKIRSSTNQNQVCCKMNDRTSQINNFC